MGLITKTVPLGGSVVSSGITVGGSIVASGNTPVVTYSYVLTENSSSDVYSDVNAFDASIYRILSMQDDMKSVAIQGKVNSEFELFLQYGEQLTSGQTMSPAFTAFNNYLGSLGV